MQPHLFNYFHHDLTVSDSLSGGLHTTLTIITILAHEMNTLY